jgi:hypothetical protein
MLLAVPRVRVGTEWSGAAGRPGRQVVVLWGCIISSLHPHWDFVGLAASLGVCGGSASASRGASQVAALALVGGGWLGLCQAVSNPGSSTTEYKQ